MSASRFRIRTLIVAVAALAVSLAAIRNPSPWWASLLFSLVVAILGLSVLALIVRTGRSRAGWLGFALFGWGYLTLYFGPWFEDHGAPYLVTSRMLRDSHEALASMGPPRLEDSPFRLINYVGAMKDCLDRGRLDIALRNAYGLAQYADSIDADLRAQFTQQIDRLPATERERLQAELAAPRISFWKGPPGWGAYQDFRRIGHCLCTLVSRARAHYLAGHCMDRGTSKRFRGPAEGLLHGDRLSVPGCRTIRRETERLPMRMSRFRIRTLILAVAALAVSLAAIRGASPWWATALFSFDLGILGFSILAAIQRTGYERAGWQGFSIFGCGYMILVFLPGFNDQVAPYLVTSKMLRASHDALAELTPPRLEESEIQALAGYVKAIENALKNGYVHQASNYAAHAATYAHYLDADQRATLLQQIDQLPAEEQEELKSELTAPSSAFWKGPPGWGAYQDFRRIGQSLCTLLVACAGALIGRALHGSGGSQATSREVGSPGDVGTQQSEPEA